MKFTTAYDTAYKFKDKDGVWTPLLRYTKTVNDRVYFKPVEDTKSTAEVQVIHVFIASTSSPVKVFKQCKFYGDWVKVPHTCGKDCPL